MEKTLLVFVLSSLLFSINSMAQNWLTAGNALSANGTLGSTTNFSVLFKSNNSERGRLTNSGLWGFGTTAPNSKVHINSASGQIPLRVQVNASTKFLVHSGGGVSIGSSSAPPANGLYVSGSVGIGTTSPQDKLHVNGTGSLARFGTGTTSTTYNYWFTGNDVGSYIEQRGNTTTPGSDKLRIQSAKSGNNVDYSQFIIDPKNGFSFLSLGNGNGNVSIAGNLGVGTVSPGNYTLKVSHTNTVGSHGFDIENTSTLDDWEFFSGDFGYLELFFNGTIKGFFNGTTGAYTGLSDERLKTNIKPMSTMLEKIRQLKPSTYQFKNATDKQEYNGFIAQDVMKIFPAMVTHTLDKERNLDVYTLDYSGFGVLAIKAIQELQPTIEEQKQEIATLKDRIDRLEAALASIKNNNGNTSNGLLEQNKPNPFTKTTTIRYGIPQGSRGQINIYDPTGKLVKALKANENGLTELSGYDLTAGTYTYTLMVNGKVALSKQMLIIK